MLITEAYRAQNAALHESREDYGTSGAHVAPMVRDLLAAFPGSSVLDYGCGKRTLEAALGFSIRNYDPAIPGLDAAPEPAGLVVCSDVLEHIEPECLDAVLDDLRRLTLKAAVLVVDLEPAKKFLADGRNAHLILEDDAWWLARILPRFVLRNFDHYGRKFLCVVTPR